jgi:hypothetical protein
MIRNKQASKDANNKTVAAIDEHLAGLKNIILRGTPYTLAQLKAVFLTDNDAISATESAHAELKELVIKEKASNKATARVRAALRNYLLAQHGPEAVALLAAFGFSPRRTGPTAEGKALAVVKMRATRKARHTTGKRARLRIKGEVPSPTPSPPPAPASNGAPAANK